MPRVRRIPSLIVGNPIGRRNHPKSEVTLGLVLLQLLLFYAAQLGINAGSVFLGCLIILLGFLRLNHAEKPHPFKADTK